MNPLHKKSSGVAAVPFGKRPAAPPPVRGPQPRPPAVQRKTAASPPPYTPARPGGPDVRRTPKAPPAMLTKGAQGRPGSVMLKKGVGQPPAPAAGRPQTPPNIMETKWPRGGQPVQPKPHAGPPSPHLRQPPPLSKTMKAMPQGPRVAGAKSATPRHTPPAVSGPRPSAMPSNRPGVKQPLMKPGVRPTTAWPGAVQRYAKPTSLAVTPRGVIQLVQVSFREADIVDIEGAAAAAKASFRRIMEDVDAGRKGIRLGGGGERYTYDIAGGGRGNYRLHVDWEADPKQITLFKHNGRGKRGGAHVEANAGSGYGNGDSDALAERVSPAQKVAVVAAPPPAAGGGGGGAPVAAVVPVAVVPVVAVVADGGGGGGGGGGAAVVAVAPVPVAPPAAGGGGLPANYEEDFI